MPLSIDMKPEIIKAYALKNAVNHGGQAILGAVINSLFIEGLKKEDIKKIIPEVQKIISEVNKLDEETQKKEFSKFESLISKREVREGLPEFQHVSKKGVVMRFAPSPSGPLHIGHAITASLSYLYIKKYGGKFYIRIEDTNPENIYVPAYKMIEKESKWLFDNVKIIIQSKRMEKYYQYIAKLFSKNAVYVCTCPSDKFKTYVMQKKECPCRNLSLTEQKKRWEKMLNKKGYKEGEAVLRFKSSMQHKNPAIRDFPLARINESLHPLQKNKYKVWPLMNLAVTVDDIDLKITHVIRGKDHRDNAEKQKMIFQVLSKKYPEDYYLGRIHLKDLELSSTQLRKDIETGKYTGWDDPKIPTIASLKKQGFQPQSILNVAEQIGMNEVDKTLEKKELFLLLKNKPKE